MRKVVVDPNVMVKWFVEEEFTECAERLRDDHLRGAIDIHAPAYAIIEFSNTLRKYVQRGIMTPENAERALKLLTDFDIAFRALDPERDRELIIDVLQYSIKNHVTAYDAYYIMLAHDLGTTFYTADEKLLRKLSDIKEERAKHICDYSMA